MYTTRGEERKKERTRPCCVQDINNPHGSQMTAQQLSTATQSPTKRKRQWRHHHKLDKISIRFAFSFFLFFFFFFFFYFYHFGLRKLNR
jgi:hypothetical protein